MVRNKLLSWPLVCAAAARIAGRMFAFRAAEETFASSRCFFMIQNEHVEAAISEVLVATFAVVPGWRQPWRGILS